MNRFRLSTLMLLVIIAALATALIVQSDRAARREARLHAEVEALQKQDRSAARILRLPYHGDRNILK